MRSVAVFAPSSVVLAGLASLVNAMESLTLVGSAATVEALEDFVAECDPDVLVVDLPEAASAFVLSRLRLATSVVALAEDHDVEVLGEALAIGGRAVLPRSASSDEIVGAIEGVAVGLVVLHSSRAKAMMTGMPAYLRAQAPEAEELTRRELQVLGMMAEGLGNKTIARRLGISDHTVKFHVSSIMRKFQAESRTEAVTTGMRRGMIAI